MDDFAVMINLVSLYSSYPCPKKPTTSTTNKLKKKKNHTIFPAFLMLNPINFAV